MGVDMPDSAPRITAKVFELPLKYTWKISRNASDVKPNVLVFLSCQGITGIGEAAPNIRYEESAESTLAFIEKARPLLESADLKQYAHLGQEILDLGPGQTAAKAALDIALLDWNARAMGVPLYRLWGLAPARTPLTSYSIGIDELPVMQKKVREARDFRVLKIKVGTDRDREIIEAVREVTDVPLRVDANEGWKDKHLALENIQWLAGKGVEFIEQPMPAAQFEDYVWLKGRSPLPLIADESVKGLEDIGGLSEGFHGINIKIMKSGGLQQAHHMISLARAHRLKVMLGCMVETSVAISAAAALTPLVDYADLDGHLLIAHDPFRGIGIKNGRIILNDLPGHGAVER